MTCTYVWRLVFTSVFAYASRLQYYYNYYYYADARAPKRGGVLEILTFSHQWLVRDVEYNIMLAETTNPTIFRYSSCSCDSNLHFKNSFFDFTNYIIYF